MLKIDENWTWDFWIADNGEEYHVYFLRASKLYKDPLTRHDVIRNPDGRQKRSSIGHAVSKDLASWHVFPDVLSHGSDGQFDDLATWTGSVVKGPDGTWYMFYTGIASESEGKIERIGFATSENLFDWTKRYDLGLVEADPTWYEKYGDSDWPNETWRDPWVFPDPNGEGWHMYITARSRIGPVDDRGVVGHAVSRDLKNWEVRPPLSESGGGFGNCEVTQINLVEGRPILLFSCLRREFSDKRRRQGKKGGGKGGVWALPCENVLGPFDIASAQLLTNDHLYSGRLVAKHDGSWALLAFINERKHKFVGGLSDPLKFCLRSDGSFELEKFK